MLIDKSTVKNRFAEWEDFCSAHPKLTADEALDRAAEEAEGELSEYVPGLTSETITPALEVRLMALIRYYAFEFRHGDTPFEEPPAIVKAYNRALDRLEMYRTGELAAPDTTPSEDTDAEKDVRVTAKRRRFGNWFTPPYE